MAKEQGKENQAQGQAQGQGQGRLPVKEYEVLVNLYMTKSLSKVVGGYEIADYVLVEEGTRFRAEESEFVLELLRLGRIREAEVHSEFPSGSSVGG